MYQCKKKDVFLNLFFFSKNTIFVKNVLFISLLLSIFQTTNVMVLTQKKEKIVAILGYKERSVKTIEDVVLITLCQMYLGASKELSHQPNQPMTLPLLVRFLLEIKRAKIANNEKNK